LLYSDGLLAPMGVDDRDAHRFTPPIAG